MAPAEGDGSDEDREWRNCEDARLRTAVSRSYYHVYVELKYRLIDARLEWKQKPYSFPSVDTHTKVRTAIESVLTRKHLLSAALRELLEGRKQADYDWLSEVTGAGAEAAEKLAEHASRAIRTLTPAEIARIAGELFQIEAKFFADREAERKARRLAKE